MEKRGMATEKKARNRQRTMGWMAGFVLILSVVGVQGVTGAELKEILLKFQPYIWVDETYTNNVDLTKTNKKSDFITTISPGIRFSTDSQNLPSPAKRSNSLRLPGSWGGGLPRQRRRLGLNSITARGSSSTRKRPTTIISASLGCSMPGIPSRQS